MGVTRAALKRDRVTIEVPEVVAQYSPGDVLKMTRSDGGGERWYKVLQVETGTARSKMVAEELTMEEAQAVAMAKIEAEAAEAKALGTLEEAAGWS